MFDILSTEVIENYINQFKRADKRFLPELVSPFPCHIHEFCYSEPRANSKIIEYKGSHLTQIDCIDSPVLFYDFLINDNQLKILFPTVKIMITFIDRYLVKDKVLLFEKMKDDAVQRSFEYNFKEMSLDIPLKSETYELFSEKVTFAIYDYLEDMIRDILNGDVASEEGFVLQLKEVDVERLFDENRVLFS